MKNEEYFFEKLDEQRLVDLQYLFKQTFLVEYSLEEIKQKHIFCPGEIKYIGFIAYDKKTLEPSAFYGVFPTEMNFEGQKVLAAQSGDTMTHPNHQKKGLFIQLALMTYDLCKELNFSFVFGFPNQNSHHGFIKYLNFFEKERLLNFTLFENKLEYNRFTTKNKILSNFQKDFSKKVFKNLCKIGQPFENSNNLNSKLVFMCHDTNYFNQKKSTTKFLIELKGVNVWLSINQNQLAIGDIDTLDLKKLKIILKRLKTITMLVGLRFLTFGGSRNALLVQQMLKLGYSERESYQPIFLNFDSEINFDQVSFLNADVDVY